MSPKTVVRLKKITVAVFSLVLLFTLTGFFILPPLLKSVAQDKLSAALHRPVSVGKVRINPYQLTLQVDDLEVGEREGQSAFAGFGSLFVRFDASSLVELAVIVREIRLEKPKFKVVRLDENRYNFSDLVDAFAARPEPQDDSPGLQFSLNNLQFSGGVVELDDQLMRSRYTLSDIHLALPFISNMAYAADGFVEPSFSARIDGMHLQLKGRSKPFADSLESEMALALNDLPLPRYTDYLPQDLPFRLQSGVLGADLKLTFRQGKNKKPSLRLAGQLAVRDIALQDRASAAQAAFKKLELTLTSADLLARRFSGKLALLDAELKEKTGASLFACERVDLALSSADLLARRFKIERLALKKPSLHVGIDAGGALNWDALVQRPVPPASPIEQQDKAKDKAKDKAPPALQWALDELALDDASVHFVDETRRKPVQIDVAELALVLRSLESSGATPVSLESRFRLNKSGESRLAGNVTAAPFNADLHVDLAALDLLPLHPWFAERLNIAITRGQLALNGDLRLQQDEKAAEFNADTLTASFAGQAMLGNLHAVDKQNSTDFLRWKSFFVDKIAFHSKPLSLSVGEMALTDFYARLVVSPQGKFNLLQLVHKDAPPAAPAVAESAAPAAEPLPPVRIDKITLQGGNVHFTDNFIKPNYTANLRKLGGRIDGLSSDPGTTARLELRGSYDDVAPLNIEARINPLSVKPYLDLQAEVRGIEMTPFSPYSGKYAGYAIDKGKLSLFVNYKIENDQLQADNRLFLDQLTFGERVESPDATSLPVNLVLALLKNRRGEIDINLPISGSLSDPQFSLGGMILKMIGNLLVKAVTSPFALIGSLFGSGEELSYVEFTPGSTGITAEAEKRLGNLAKALLERPGLTLEIAARADAEHDPEGLRRERLERKVRAAKSEEMASRGIEVDKPGQLVVSAEEYPALLERAYQAEPFPKPRNMIGMLKRLPVEEMEKLMLTHSPVNDDDLRDLAEERARAVRDWLRQHEVPAERLFLLPVKVADKNEAADSGKKLKESRVNFSLK